MKEYARFLWRCLRVSFVGDWRYHLWMLMLTVLALVGLNAYAKQLVQGLATTGMSDQVSWGLYIANFLFLEGMAAAALMFVIPVYVYRRQGLKDMVIFGELLAVSAIVMCLAFVTADLGRPDVFHHLMLRLNFPDSMLAWDVVVLNGFLLLNMHICGYLIYCAYRRRAPSPIFYVPFVFIAVIWAICIYTVAAFLFVGLGGRPFWNSAILVPRFIASAFAVGPAFLIITLAVLDRFTSYEVPPKSFRRLKMILTTALTIDIFLLACELFTEFYTGSAHAVSAQYLFFGLHGANALVPWIWTSIGLIVFALVLLYLRVSTVRNNVLYFACLLTIVGIWIEKCFGMVIPGFVPSPLGEVVEYTPTLNEVLVSVGIWAGGLMLFTVLVRITIPVLAGRLTFDTRYYRGLQPPSVSTDRKD